MVSVRLAKDKQAQIDRWRIAHGLRTRSAAINALIDKGLEAD